MAITYEESIPDASSYFQLYETTGWNHHYKADQKDIERMLANTWYSVSAYHGRQLVGYGRVISDSVFYGIICDMIVAPEFQKKGIGSEITDRLKNKCMASGLRTVSLFSAEGKRGFYMKHGFTDRPQSAPGMQMKLYDR